MFSRDNRGDDLFSNSTIDTSNPDKIVIREKEAPKKKVRRRVKKDAVSAKRQEVKKASKVKIVGKKKEKKSIYDTTSFDFTDLDTELPDEQISESKEEKEFRLPRLSEINKKDDFDNDVLGSDFRQSSANWKDAVIPDYSGLDDLSGTSFFDSIKNASWMQWVAIGLAVILFVSSILTTNVYAKLQCADSRAKAFSKLSTYEDNSFSQVASIVESVEEPISLEEAKPQFGKILSLVLSSVEKDLKIKLIDEDETLVKNIPWSVTVADSDGNTSEEADDDQDGIIHITDINAGDYTVTLNPNDLLSDFELPSSAQMVSVKAKVEYKVIANIKDEIKSEKEINAAAEDAAGNQAADVETAPVQMTDTVELVDSTMIVDGEDYVEATPDLSKIAAGKSVNKLLAVIEKIRANAASNFGDKTLGYPVLLAYTDSEGKTYEPVDSTHHSITTVDEEGTSSTVNEECSFGDDGKCKCGNEKCKHTNTKLEKGDKTHHNVVCSDCGYTVNSNVECNFSSSNTCECGNTKQEETISLDRASASIKVGESVTITATVSSGTASFTSSNTSVATVDSSGKVTGVKAGTATITATANGKSASCDITVTANDTETSSDASIALSGTTTITVGSSTTINVAMTPSGAKISSAVSSDTAVATVSVGGNSVLVKGVKAGTAKITVKSDNGKESSTTITVKAADQKYSPDAQLYDSSKNALYVKEGGSYRLAKYKDYESDSSQKFYRKVETFLYTGWQTIDGQKCYFDKNHNKVTGKQIIGGVEYDFGESGTVSTGSGSLGIDVSKYQPSINWSAVKASGVEYVIIRCGYRGSSTGVLVEDPYFKSHIKGAKAAGLKVGVYFFTTALTEAEAVEEASMCAYLCNGYGLDFPIFMDCESSPRAGYNGMSANQRTAVIKAFCNTIKSAGYSAGVYANKTWFTSYIHAGELSGCKIWLAQYNSAGPTYSGRYDMWQYTSKGSVNGISGYVDMNKCYYR